MWVLINIFFLKKAQTEDLKKKKKKSVVATVPLEQIKVAL